MKQADQPAANSCSGLVPLPAVPGDDNLMSRSPSELREAPSRPPVVCVLAVYSTFSIWLMTCSLVEMVHVAGYLERVCANESPRKTRVLRWQTLLTAAQRAWQRAPARRGHVGCASRCGWLRFPGPDATGTA